MSHFLDVPQQLVSTSEGLVAMPILYRDVSALTAMFRVPVERVAPLLEGSGLQAVPALGADALVVLAWFEYRDCTIGPYNEVGLAALVVPQGQSPSRLAVLDMFRPLPCRQAGMHILDLPVTSAMACAAGRELWGFPKFITPIPWTVRAGRFEGRVQDPRSRQTICEMAGTLGPGVPMPSGDILLYGRFHGELIRTRVEVRTRQMAHRGAGLTLSVGASHHAMASRLRALGLDGASPMMVQRTSRFQSRLHLGERLG